MSCVENGKLRPKSGFVVDFAFQLFRDDFFRKQNSGLADITTATITRLKPVNKGTLLAPNPAARRLAVIVAPVACASMREVVNMLPVEAARSTGADTIISLALGVKNMPKPAPHSHKRQARSKWVGSAGR